MEIDEIRMNVATLKAYIGKMEDWLRQAGLMLFQIEEHLMDIEEKNYESKYNMFLLNEAAIGNFRPARLEMDRCGKDHTDPAAFVQGYKSTSKRT